METVIQIINTVKRVIFSPPVLIGAAIAIVAFIAVVIYRNLRMRALSHMQYERSFSTDGVFAGEEFTLTEKVHNPTLFPLFFVEVDFFAPSGLIVDGVRCSEYTKSTSIFHIPPYSTVEKVHTVRSDRRDRYRLQSAGVLYRETEFVYDVPIEVYVYPDNYYSDIGVADHVKLAGESIARKKYIDDPFFFSGIRPYAAGDPMRSINHKASVRSFSGGQRQLMCNFYDSSRNFDTMIYLDLTDYYTTENFEKYRSLLEDGLRCACYLFCTAETEGGRVGFATNCATESSRFIEIPCSSGNMHTKKMLECFAEISAYARHDYSMNSLLREAIKLPQDTDIYFITPHVDDKNAELIGALERTGRSVSVIGLEVGV